MRMEYIVSLGIKPTSYCFGYALRHRSGDRWSDLMLNCRTGTVDKGFTHAVKLACKSAKAIKLGKAHNYCIKSKSHKVLVSMVLLFVSSCWKTWDPRTVVLSVNEHNVLWHPYSWAKQRNIAWHYWPVRLWAPAPVIFCDSNDLMYVHD